MIVPVLMLSILTLFVFRYDFHYACVYNDYYSLHQDRFSAMNEYIIAFTIIIILKYRDKNIVCQYTLVSKFLTASARLVFFTFIENSEGVLTS